MLTLVFTSLIIQFNQLLHIALRDGNLSYQGNYCQEKTFYLIWLISYLKEKLHLNFCKYLLGVNSKAIHLDVRGENRRYPLMIQIIASMFKYTFKNIEEWSPEGNI